MTEEKFSYALWQIGAVALGWLPHDLKPSDEVQKILCWLSSVDAPKITKIWSLKDLYDGYLRYHTGQNYMPMGFDEWLSKINKEPFDGFIVFNKHRPKEEGIVLSMENIGERKLDS